jgi:hypothetical protein
MENKYFAPAFNKSSFTCPHCGVLAKQDWSRVTLDKLKDQAKNLIAQTVESQNESIPELLKGYNTLRKDTKDQYSFKNEKRYTLKGDFEPETEWISEAVGKLVEIANRESGYNYAWTDLTNT